MSNPEGVVHLLENRFERGLVLIECEMHITSGSSGLYSGSGNIYDFTSTSTVLLYVTIQ